MKKVQAGRRTVQATLLALALVAVGALVAGRDRVPATTSAAPSPATTPESAGRTVTSPSPGRASEERIPIGFPTSRTTGVPPNVRLTSRLGDLTIDEPGTVIDGLDVQGCVSVKADDVIIRRSRIRCDGAPGLWPIRVYPEAQGLLVEDVEIDGAGNATVAVQGQDYTLVRNNIHNVIDGPRLASNSQVLDSMIHSLVHLPESHNDVLQTLGGDNIVVRGNTLLAYDEVSDDPMNGVIQTGRLKAPLRNMLVEENYMDGGSFTIRGGSVTAEASLIDGYIFRNNVLGRNCGFGPVSGVDAPVTWEANNHWLDDLQEPITTDATANKVECMKRMQSRTKLGQG